MEPEHARLEFIAPDVETAIVRAQAELGVLADDLAVEVLDKGDTVAGRDARIQVRLASSTPSTEIDLSETAFNVVTKLLDNMAIHANVKVSYQEQDNAKEDHPTLHVDVEGEDLGLLIGRQGKTIAAIQYIARLITANIFGHWVNLYIDVGGYKKNREQQLRRLSQRMAEQVHRFGRPISLEPMPAYERRIVHITLQDHPEVTTESSGEGNRRRVTILPELLR